MQIVLDLGSGNTCKNSPAYVEKMINAIKEVDTGKHEVVLKFQLFEKAGENIPLNHFVFEHAYNYAKSLGYKTTSSVFDIESLKFLLEYDIPFVKIANARELDYLIGETPRKIPVYVSHTNKMFTQWPNITLLPCISCYPATPAQYKFQFGVSELRFGFSDHTAGLELFNECKPKIWEKHFKLSDSTGLDSGEFAITPEELKEIL